MIPVLDANQKAEIQVEELIRAEVNVRKVQLDDASGVLNRSN
jgi:hypothetical protein